MNLFQEPLTAGLSINSAALLAGIALLSPVFPFTWFIAPRLVEARMELFLVLFADSLISIGTLALRNGLRTRLNERRHAESVSSALRRNSV